MAVWLRWLLLGILSIVFGIFALNNAVLTSLAVTTVVGVLFLISGVIQAVVGFGDDGAWNKILSVGLGVLMAILGISFLANPFSGTISLALLVTVFIGAAGIVRIVLAWRMKQTRFFWMMLISGALSVLLALYILANPGLTVALLGILLGIELLFNGAGLIVLALFLRTAKGRMDIGRNRT